MLRDTCRVCNQKLLAEPLLRYENMPSVAQFLPDAASLDGDRGVCLEVCQCAGCGLVQLRGEPVPYFREVIRASAVSQDMKDFRRKQFSQFVQRFALGGKKVVESGCGRGEFLDIMRECGADACGLEYGEVAAAECVRKGLRVDRAFVDGRTGALRDGPFDAFFILNFLEHLPDPNGMLRGIHRNLADGAVGLVEVPNFDMILRKKLFSEFTTDHLLYFTRETLKTALRLNGFDTIECREEWYQYILSAVVRKRPRLDLSDFHRQQAQMKEGLQAFVARFRDGGVAIWGAGHQAFATIALSGLSDKIRYVVDSAPFKQGRYTPATHIPIVAPDALSAEPVAAVIVMAGSYSDEVAGIIRQKYGTGMEVVILRDSGLEAAHPSRGAKHE